MSSHARDSQAFVNFLPGRNNQGIVVRKDFHLFRYALKRISGKSRIIIEPLQSFLRFVLLEVECVCAHQVGLGVPIALAQCDRLLQPRYGVAVISGNKLCPTDDPIKSAQGRVARAQLNRLLHQLRRVRRPAERGQLVGFFG
jgi:hypothetical protein